MTRRVGLLATSDAVEPSAVYQWREGTGGAVYRSLNMYEEELLYLRSRGMAPAGPLGLHPYLGGGLPANLTDHLDKYHRLGFHGKSWRLRGDATFTHL